MSGNWNFPLSEDFNLFHTLLHLFYQPPANRVITMLLAPKRSLICSGSKISWSFPNKEYIPWIANWPHGVSARLMHLQNVSGLQYKSSSVNAKIDIIWLYSISTLSLYTSANTRNALMEIFNVNIDGLVQERRYHIANPLELPFCNNPSICFKDNVTYVIC